MIKRFMELLQHLKLRMKLLNAAKKVTDSGYIHFDVNTPYPVHGMDKAMKIKPSKLGFVTLGYGIKRCGNCFAL